MSGKIRDLRYKQSVPMIGKRVMSIEHRGEVQQAMLLINHHRAIADSIEQGMRELLIKHYNADIATGNWNINLQTGEMQQIAKPSTE